MKISTLIFLIGGTAAGIYLQSEQGEDSRKKLKESFDNITPVVKDLASKLETMIKETETIRTDEVRVNIEKKINSLKKTISKIDSTKIASITDDAIKSAAKKVRELRSEISKEPVASIKVETKSTKSAKPVLKLTPQFEIKKKKISKSSKDNKNISKSKPAIEVNNKDKIKPLKRKVNVSKIIQKPKLQENIETKQKTSPTK